MVSSSLPISAVSISDLAYRVVGSTISQSDRITILDIGIFVYRKFSPDTDHFEADQVFITELELGVDPYFYFEILSKLPNVPALIYSWRIAAILQKTGPFESGLSSGQKIGVCDKKRRSYKEITERMLGTTKKVDALSTYFSASYYRLSPNFVSFTAAEY